jgi:hypothetical protein
MSSYYIYRPFFTSFNTPNWTLMNSEISIYNCPVLLHLSHLFYFKLHIKMEMIYELKIIIRASRLTAITFDKKFRLRHFTRLWKLMTRFTRLMTYAIMKIFRDKKLILSPKTHLKFVVFLFFEFFLRNFTDFHIHSVIEIHYVIKNIITQNLLWKTFFVIKSIEHIKHTLLLKNIMITLLTPIFTMKLMLYNL